MIPAPFDYDVAETVDHAVELLGEGGGDAKVLAGGQSLLPAMKLRIARPTRLVDLGRLADLAYVKDVGTHVAIGALTRHSAVAADPLLREHCPIVSFTAGQIGDPQVRHRGTMGGTLSHGDPASDLPAVMLALGAELDVRGQGGDRTIQAAEFFTGGLRDGPLERRGAGGGPCAEARRLDGLGVPQGEPPRTGLGDGGVSRRSSIETTERSWAPRSGS